MRPSQVENAIGQTGISVLFGQRIDSGARFSDTRDDIDPGRFVRLQHNRLPNADDGIQHRSCGVRQRQLTTNGRRRRERSTADR